MAGEDAGVLETVRSALRAERRIGLDAHPIAMTFADGTLTLEGEVETVTAKRLALERAAALPAVAGIVDRLHVAPATHMSDAEIRRSVRRALQQEPAFGDFALQERVEGLSDAAREPPKGGGTRGSIQINVEDGLVTLNGSVPGLDDKRLAGVLAWWVPGSRDVINGIAVEPPEEDGDDKIADAVRLVLDKDPFIDAGQLRVGVRNAAVTMAGFMPSEAEREMAESDAWYVFGVDKVINRIETRGS